MKSRILPFLTFILFTTFASAQLNVEYLGQIDYDSEGNDVWGYVGSDGSEYAIMGTFNGVSIVNVTDPTNPQEIQFIDQQASTWRDMKTFGEFAYVTSDEPGTNDGLLIIDMTGLPDSVTWRNTTDFANGQATINTCHNIYIDEFGYAYLAGCNVKCWRFDFRRCFY